jgi:hypothetical protein
MELENQTPFPAALFRGCIDEERIAASLVVRRTFDLVAGYLVRAPEEIWPVSGGPFDGPAGPMAGDDLFYRGGVDLFAFGSARSAKPVPRVDVTVEAGKEFKYSVAVFGDRVWTKAADGSVVPGAPKPFTEMPLTMANAYGGADEWDELPVPYPANPGGKGYALSADSALGKPLPNVENPKALIRKFGEHPEAVGVASPPYPYVARVPRTVEHYPNGVMKKLDPKFFNAAFPDMVVPKLTVGDRIKITGMTADRPIGFEIPPADVRMRLQLGDKIHEVIPPVDQVGVEVDRSRVFVTYRHAFRYKVVLYVKRRCELLPYPETPR